MSPTYDPQTKLFYVTAREQCDIFATAPQPYEAGHAYYGSAYFPNDETQPFWEPCARLIPPRASSSGNGSILRRRGLECFPRQAGWCLRETRKETSLRSKRLQGKCCGTSNAARRFLHRRCLLRLTANNTLRLRRDRRCLRLVCHEAAVWESQIELLWCDQGQDARSRSSSLESSQKLDN